MQILGPIIDHRGGKDGGNTDGFSYPQKNLQRSPKQ